MIELTRSSGIFDPESYNEEIHVIGVGATGSHVVELLVLHGIKGKQIHVYDFDVVEPHNIANQTYTLNDVGKPKVDALKDRLELAYNETINTHNTKVESCKNMKGIVFLLIDGEREKLFNTLKMNVKIKFLIETGLDARQFRLISLDVMNLDHMKYFEKEYLNVAEEVIEKSVCGSKQVVASTVKMLASVTMWEFIKCLRDETRIGHDIYASTDSLAIFEKKI